MSASEQAIKVQSELIQGLQRLRGLLKNRSAWADAAEGARYAVTVIEQALKQMDALCETIETTQVELAGYRADSERAIRTCAEMTQELAAVRGELEGWKLRQSALIDAQADVQTLLAEKERLSTEIGGFMSALATARTQARALLKALPG